MGLPDYLPSTSPDVSLEHRVAELTILYEVSRALQKTLDEEEALYTILLGVTAGLGLGFNRAFILLVDPEEKYLEGRLAIGPASSEEAFTIWGELREKYRTLAELFNSFKESGIKKDLRVNEIVARFRISLTEPERTLVRIMRSREPCVVMGGVCQPQGLQVLPDVMELLGTGDFAVAPLYMADRDLGILLADNSITKEPIDEGNLKLLQIYAQAASAAIQNTRLYRQVTEKMSLCENINLSLRESQQHLLQAERLSTIGKMAALVAHEIRTPLVSIGGFARRLLRSTSPDDPRREGMEIIISEVARLERLVKEVLQYSKIPKPEFKSTDINKLIRSILLTMQAEIQKNSIHVVLTQDPELPVAQADESQLRQAIMNLLNNAVDAMPSGGTLTVTTSSNGESLEIGISDTGVGIPQEHWNKIFTPFFTTKVRGIGLGLDIVAQIIDNHNGTLRFESLPGKGTCFSIRLAFHPSNHSAAPTSPAQRAEEIGGAI